MYKKHFFHEYSLVWLQFTENYSKFTTSSVTYKIAFD